MSAQHHAFRPFVFAQNSSLSFFCFSMRAVAMDTQGMRKVLRLYRALSGQGGRLFRAREDERAELGALLAPLRKLGLLEGPEDNSKFILCHDADTVAALWCRLTAAAKHPMPESATRLSVLLAYMDNQRLPLPGEEEERETDIVTVGVVIFLRGWNL